ncbi:MAG: hypothetical protein KA788_09115 [Lacunisphaera sp.]|jgi:hypothetical protein|nr:hypothetical protein [Lacunisphaera sp.]
MDATTLALIISVSSLFISASVAWIQNKNQQIAAEKLKLELFEKRFAVYQAAQKLLTQVLQDGDIKELKYIFEYRRDTQVAYFLFDQEIVTYLSSLDKKALDLWAKNEKARAMDIGDERVRLSIEANGIAHELINELPELQKAFEPFLRFKSWS